MQTDPRDGSGLMPGSVALAKQTLKSLRERWGVQEVDSWKIAPSMVRVKCMGYTEYWRLKELHPVVETPKSILDREYELYEKTKDAVK